MHRSLYIRLLIWFFLADYSPAPALSLPMLLMFVVAVTHRFRGQSRDVKKCQWNLRAPWKSARQELRNEPPHDIVAWLPQNPFLASLWIRSGLGWPERDFGVVIQLCHVGARFEALGALIFMAPSDSIGIFFTSLDCHLERCVTIQWSLPFIRKKFQPLHSVEVWILPELQVNFFPRAPMKKSYKIRPI